MMREVGWESGEWFNHPNAYHVEGHDLFVTTAMESDLWRNTSYGFVHDSAHALLVDFPDNCAIEVSFILDYQEQFDQAGLLVRANEENWIKAGVEYADGVPQLGAVVTNVNSDWSVAPIPEWFGKEVTIRASRNVDALTVRAKCGGAWRLIRLAPLNPQLIWRAGPHCASPLRQGLQIRFTHFSRGDPDHALH